MRRRRCLLEAIDLARQAVEAASSKQATDIVLLDAREVCGFADYFVICTGDSDRQIQAIQDEIEHSLSTAGAAPAHREGTTESGWLLLDYGDLVVHVFGPAERDFYQLDKLWSRATPLLRVQ